MKASYKYQLDEWADWIISSTDVGTYDFAYVSNPVTEHELEAIVSGRVRGDGVSYDRPWEREREKLAVEQRRIQREKRKREIEERKKRDLQERKLRLERKLAQIQQELMSL